MKKALSAKNVWDAAPRSVRAAAGRVLGLIPLPVILGRAFRRNRRFVGQADRWSAAQARGYALDQLRRLGVLAYEKTRFYRKTFAGVGFDPRDLKRVEDLQHLPTIDKTTIQNHLDEMCTTSTNSRRVDYASTGGTSGTPLAFYMPAGRSAVEYAYLVTSWQRAGYTPGMPLAVLRGKVVSEDRHGLRHEYDPLLRHHTYSNFHMTDENMGRYLEHIAGLGPCMLHVYPSSVAALARFVRRSGLTPPRNIRGIIAESEIVYDDQRRLAEEVFGCRYFSCYGHTEKLVLAAECEHSVDYHVWPTYGYFELLDDEGKPITTPGRRGEIVGTGFINAIVPFIRYRTGDYATYVGDRCDACGREHVIIKDIQGHRTQEVLVAADGSEISWTSLNMHDDTFAHVRQFQFYQDTPGRAVLKVIPAEGFAENDGPRILRNLGRKFDGRLDFTIECTDAIALSPRAKAIYVDQRIARNDS